MQNVRLWRKKVLDKRTQMWFNRHNLNQKTVEAEITLLLASTENPWCWEWGEKRSSKWTAEGRRNRHCLSIFWRVAPVTGQTVCWHCHEWPFFRQARWYRRKIPVLAPCWWEWGLFYLSERRRFLWKCRVNDGDPQLLSVTNFDAYIY